MYEDAWYNAFVPSAPSRPEPSHKRRVSLLKQPNEDIGADTGLPEIISAVADAPKRPPSPPKATVNQRAHSVADFRNLYKQRRRAKTGKRRLDYDAQKKPRRRSQIHEEVEAGGNNIEDSGNEFHNELLDGSHEKYQLYLDQLQASQRHLDTLLEDITANLDLLSTLSSSFRQVEAQSDAFQNRCESLLSEEQRMSSLANDVGRNLQYYNFLDPITRRMNAPGIGSFVRGDEFKKMLSQLDVCLDYMHSHPDHRESSIYESKYRLMLTRGLTLIRVHFTNTLRETAADVSKRIADRQLNDTTMPALLYAKFRVAAPELKQLGLEIQKRADPPAGAEPGTEGEYQSLVYELHQSYSAARGRLIIPLVRKKMAEIDIAPSASKDLVAFARSSISYIRGICLDEFELWHEWFEDDSGLYEFLEAVCDPLYDYLRPRTIRETQLPKLCEMCSLLQARYMDENEDESEEEESNQLDFATLIRPALEDAQTRLVFLALAVLRDDIERFKPKPEDLNYPAKNRNVPLSGTKSRAPALSGRKASINGPDSQTPKAPVVVEEDGTDGLELKWRYDSSGSFQGWFPTLKKAIWLLSKIYRLVNSKVFDDIAHQIVHQTTLSLHSASLQISTRATPTDSQLFLLKQLLVLKQQIVAFDIEFVTPDVDLDFSTVTSTFWELRERGGLFNPGNLFRLVGSSLMPRVVENMLDAKAELDARLRAVITDFTNGAADNITKDLTGRGDGKLDAEKLDPQKAMAALKGRVEKEVPTMRRKLDEYLEDVRTKETLVAAVQDQTIANFEDFHQTCSEAGVTASVGGGGGGGASGGTVTKGKHGNAQDSQAIWDPDTFADWAASVFQVGGADKEEGGGGAESPAGSISPGVGAVSP